MWFNLALILYLLPYGLCLRYPFFNFQEPNYSTQRSFLATVHPISYESNALEQNGFVTYTPNPTVRLRTPRDDMNYQYLTVSSPKTYRRYRSILPTSSEDTVTAGLLQPHGNRQLRILSWLFGRPGYSPFPTRDYSSLEAAAGISHNNYPSPLGSSIHSSPVMVEECEEFLDTITHEIIEECEDVGIAY
ncbi:unnamed protein product [Orchesella dallaii]|uniref:Uncharacterized protein n=1 Tax=Orchesella dallaii TaxID=48710 RepID=A0ABP1QEC5_9HEXA